MKAKAARHCRGISNFLGALLLGLLFGPLGAAQTPATGTAKPPLVLCVLTSTGESFQGELKIFKSNRLELKARSQSVGVHAPNIIRIDVVGREPAAKLSPAKRSLEAGKVLLELGQLDLAALAFSLAMELNGKLSGDVQATYDAAKVAPPKAFVEGAKTDRPARRYPLCTDEQIDSNRKKTEEWAAKAQEIAPAMHRLETPSFLVYSAWPAGDDAALKEVYGKLYQAMCKQFDIDPREHIWAGRLPVFAFWTRDDFVRFCVEVVDVPPFVAANAGGFAGAARAGDGMLHYVVLGPVQEKAATKAQARGLFFELLVHESSHAFMSRYIRERPIPSWVEEGVAETMASTLLPGTQAAMKLQQATKRAARESLPVDDVFDVPNIPLDWYHYGIAQSFVRFLIQADRMKFIQFVGLLKEGKSDQEALQEAYGASRGDMVAAWRRAIAQRFQ